MLDAAQFLAQVEVQTWLQRGLIAFFVLLGLILIFLIIRYGAIWIQAYVSGAEISLMSLIGMTLRQVPAARIVTAKIMAKQAGLNIDYRTGISTQKLEAHYLAGGNVIRLVQALIAAHRAVIDLDFERAAAIELAGRDVFDAVRTSVSPKVIDCPKPVGGVHNALNAVAKDGVELLVRARVTVRTNLAQLIGGATEDTIIARVCEGIVTVIGSSDTHMQVLETPASISEGVLRHGLDANTAFEIVSIDIMDVDVGKNIGARLQTDQAEADTRVARAKAEIRRADAIAKEQQNSAKVVDCRVALIRAEAEVPKALAFAIRAGNLAPQGRPAAFAKRSPQQRPLDRLAIDGPLLNRSQQGDKPDT
ncbi:MAG: flotillin-like protein FloA [Blastopirellula sp. JB062]